MSRDGLDVRPLGSVHPSGRCYRCGSRGHLVLVTVKETHAKAFQCYDVTACIRRTTAARNDAVDKLFMRSPPRRAA
jgi:hypothetical protein